MEPTLPAISFAQPVYGHIPPACVISCEQLIAFNVAKRLFVNVDHTLGTYIDVGRNMLVTKALAHPNKVTHLLFVDQDMVVPLTAPARLAAHGKQVVGGAYFLKTVPFTPVAYNFTPDFEMLPRLPHRKLAKVGGVGMGCTLIDMSVFRDMQKHFGDDLWFHTSNVMGEDVWFCDRLGSMGIPVYLDRTVSCTHVGDVGISENQYRYALAAREETKPRRQRLKS